jgi:hypothetical protein
VLELKAKTHLLAGLGQQKPFLATKTDAGNKNRCWQQKPMLATKTVAKGKKGKK